MLLCFIFRNRTIEIMYFVICFCIVFDIEFYLYNKRVQFQFLFFQAFNEAGVSLVPGLVVPRTTVPKLSINHTELVNFIQAIVSTGVTYSFSPYSFPPPPPPPRKNEYILVFPPERSVYTHLSP